MAKNDGIPKIVDIIINDYLSKHSDLRRLFNDESESKDMFAFFENNFGEIYSAMGRLFRENKKYGNDYDQLWTGYLNCLESDLNEAKAKKKLKSVQKRMLVATLINLLVSKDLSVEDLPIDNTDLQNNDGAHWYRGQSDYQWGLIPSMFRNLSNVFSKPTMITQKTIEDIYSGSGMLKKWTDIFKDTTVDYNFLAYMQHSIAYSPLLDFTSDFPTALSFSLGNKSALNDFQYKDSSVFQIEVKSNRLFNKEEDPLPQGFYIQYIPEKYIIGTSVFGKSIGSFDDIIKALTPDFVMIDIVRNDRMKYQHGKFLFFYNYLSIQGTICTWLNKDLRVTKYRINKNEKDRWCDKLRKEYPYLMIEKMMNPYSYFSDQ